MSLSEAANPGETNTGVSAAAGSGETTLRTKRKSSLNPRVERILKIVLVTYMVLQVLFVVAFAAHPPVGAIGLILIGRGPQSGVVESIQSYYRRWHTPVKQQEANAASLLVRKEGGFQLIRTPWGEIWEPEIDGSAILAQIGEINGKYDGFEGTPIHKGDIVLDGGANVGVTTLHALRLGAAKVVAIEPAPANVAILERNFAKEIAEGRVIVYPKGVWDKDDILPLSLNEDTTAMDSVVIKRVHATKTVNVPLTTIDKLVAELGLERVDMIKLDTEGAEKPALRGATKTIAKWHPRFEISVDHLPNDPVEVPALLRSIDPTYKMRCLVSDADYSAWRVNSTILFFD
ncbi:MAG: FkbM family methyltransferase [Acidobacteriota bacterium]